MTRAHIEFVQQQDLAWDEVELAPGAPTGWRKLLSIDERRRAFTAMIRVRAGWVAGRMPGGQGASELFVLDGRLELQVGDGGVDLKKGGYLRMEDERLCVGVAAPVAAELLYMSAIGPEAGAGADGGGEPFTFVDSEKAAWKIPWVPGPDPGLKIKLLWRSELTGAYTRLISAEPGWAENRLEHHDCIEEVFLLAGDMTMGSLGTMTGGAYIWRPPGIKHGPMQTCGGSVMFVRTDGPLENYYTTVDGAPINY